MDVTERLSLETIESRTLLASEHVHRYELAAALCARARVLDLACGTGYGSAILAEVAADVRGVDIDVATIEVARHALGDKPGISFAASDASAYLRRCEPGDIDVVVCFEGLEHLRELDEAVNELARLARGGVKLVISLPNGAMWKEENPYHVTTFSLERATELLARLGDYKLLAQNFVEGSMIVDPDDPGSVPPPELRWPERVEVEYANHYVGLVNFDESEVRGAVGANLQATYAPAYNRHIRNIERANDELWRANARLAWRAHTHSGAAAASRTRRLQRTLEERDREIVELNQELAVRDGIIREYVREARERASGPGRRRLRWIARAVLLRRSHPDPGVRAREGSQRTDADGRTP
jgi:SAM-dependent methyltransferase